MQFFKIYLADILISKTAHPRKKCRKVSQNLVFYTFPRTYFLRNRVAPKSVYFHQNVYVASLLTLKGAKGGTLYPPLYILDHIRFRFCENLNVCHWYLLYWSCRFFKQNLFSSDPTIIFVQPVEKICSKLPSLQNAHLTAFVYLA